MENPNEQPESNSNEDWRKASHKAGAEDPPHRKQGQTKEKPNNQPKEVDSNIIDIMEGKPFQGHGSLHGHNFQTKVLCLYSCIIHTFKNFRLATEVGAAGKFDDLVLCYDGPDNVRKYTFLQAKQILKMANPLITPNDLVTDNPNFELKKYFQSYIDIQKQLDSKETNSCIEYLIMYTNAHFDENLFMCVDASSSDIQFDNDKTFVITKIKHSSSPLILKNSYRFVHIPRKALKLDNPDDEKYCKGFQEKLIFSVKQADYNKIANKIQTELSNTFNLVESNALCNELVGEMWNVFAQKIGQARSHEIEAFFASKRMDLTAMFQHHVIFENRDDVVIFPNYFKDISKLKSFIDSKRAPNFSCVLSDTTALTSIKVAQTLQYNYCKKLYPEQYFANVDLNQLTKQETRLKVFNTFRNKKEFTLVVRWNDKAALKKDVVRVLEDMLELAESCETKSNKSIIFICKSEFDHKKLKAITKMFDIHVDNCYFDNLTTEAREEIMSRQVCLQCQNSKLSEIIDLEYLEGMQNNIFLVDQISDCTGLNIGTEINDSYLMDHSYVERFFIRDFKYCKNILENVPYSEVLVFSNVDLRELEKHINGKSVITFNPNEVVDIKGFLVFLLKFGTSEQESFELICKSFPFNNIHWLMKNGDSFHLMESVQNRHLNENEISDISGNINVILGEPGIGKSCVLASILEKEKAKDNVWAIRIDLSSVVNSLDELKKMTLLEIKNIIDFVCEVEKLSKAFEKELLLYTMLKTNNCFLLFDGFDEICPDYEDIVIQLLNLLQMTKANIWLTTRPHYQAKLESNLSCLCFSLIPFSEDDQRSFLKSYWCNSIDENLDLELVENFTNKFLTAFEKSKIHFASQFTGIPLQTRMLAEIYTENCKMYCQNPEENPIISVARNILELYENFIQMKHDIYFSEKLKLNIKSSKLKNLRTAASEKVNEQYSDLAILLTLTEEFQAIAKSRTFDENEELEMLDVGLIFKRSEKCHFIHRTFAEYYVAKKLADILFAKTMNDKTKDEVESDKLNDEYLLVRNFLIEQYFDENMKMVRIFLDHLLVADCPFLNDILDDNLELLKDKLSKGEYSSNECDVLGRTALHLSAAYSISKGPELLWKFHKTLNITDLLGCNVLNYAIRRTTKNNNPILGFEDFLKSYTNTQAFDETILNVFQIPGLTENEIITLNKFITYFYPPNKVNYWKKNGVKMFLIRNMEKFKKVKTFLEAGSPIIPLDKYPLEFFIYALKTDKYFNELLLNKNIDLSSLGAIKRFTESKEFINWFKICVHSIDFACMQRIEEIFGFKKMRKLTQVLKDDCSEMVRQAALNMQHDCVCKFICTYKFSWTGINFAQYLANTFLNRKFSQFEQLYQSALSVEMKTQVLEAITYVSIFKEAIVYKAFDNVEKLFEYFGSDAQIKEMKASVSNNHVIACFKAYITKYRKLKFAPFLKCISDEESNHVWNTLVDKSNERKHIRHFRNRQNTILEVTISNFHLPIILQWLDNYTDAMEEDYHWSVWEHLYCIFSCVEVGRSVPPDIHHVFGDDYLFRVVMCKANFEDVAFIFHLVLDKQRCETCLLYDFEFLRYALCHYFHEITNEKCNNGHYLRNFKDDIILLEEFKTCLVNAATNCDFAILSKLMSIVDYDNLLPLFKVVDYKMLFQTAFHQMEINFLLNLLKIFKGLPDELDETLLFQSILSTMQFQKLDQLLKYIKLEQALKILSPIGCVQEFKTAIREKDFKSLDKIYGKYKDFDSIIDVMKKDVKDDDCIKYFNHFLVKSNSSGICSLFQFISLEEGVIYPRFFICFECSNWERKIKAVSKRYLQNLLTCLGDYPSAYQLENYLNVWQHVYITFGCLFDHKDFECIELIGIF